MADGTAYDRAVAMRHAGEAAAAADLFEEWLAIYPDDTDALVQYGYALLAIDRLDDAERVFTRVLELAPDYTDANDGLQRILERRAPSTEAQKAFVLIDGSLSKVEAGQDDWREIGATASAPLDTRTIVVARGTWYERFEEHDAEFGIVASHRAKDGIWLRFGGSFTPAAAFRPEVGLTGGLDRRIAKSAIASFDAAWQRFPLQTVWSFRPGLLQYFDGDRYVLSVHANAVAVDGSDVLIGGSLRGDYFPKDRTRLFIGFSSGPETDLGQVRETTSLHGGGELPLTNSISISGSLAQEWRAVGSSRTEVRVGLKVSL